MHSAYITLIRVQKHGTHLRSISTTCVPWKNPQICSCSAFAIYMRILLKMLPFRLQRNLSLASLFARCCCCWSEIKSSGNWYQLIIYTAAAMREIENTTQWRDKGVNEKIRIRIKIPVIKVLLRVCRVDRVKRSFNARWYRYCRRSLLPLSHSIYFNDFMARFSFLLYFQMIFVQFWFDGFRRAVMTQLWTFRIN